MPHSNFTSTTGNFAAFAAATAILPNSPIPASPPFFNLKSPISPSTTIIGEGEQHNNCEGTTPASGGTKSQQKNPKLYKTELCRSWMETGRCNYGERCQYAHGEREKRPVTRHPKYKTEQCQSYHKTGYCPYGPRCHFIHNENATQLKAMIKANEQAMRMVHELAALGIEQQLQQQSGTPKKWSMLGQSPMAKSSHLHFNTTLDNKNSINSSSSPFLNAIGTTAGFISSPIQKNLQSPIGHQHQFLGKAQSYRSQQEVNFFPSIYRRQLDPFEPANGGSGGQTEHQNYWGTTNSPSSIMNYQKERPKTLQISFNANHANNCFRSSDFETSTSVLDPNWFFPSGIKDECAYSSSKDRHSSPPILPMQFAFLNEDNEFCDSDKQHTHKAATECAVNGVRFCDEFVPQQLLGNLCASDEEYSRSSIVSSNIDSGNESPMALLFEEDVPTVNKSMPSHESQQTTPLPSTTSEDEQILNEDCATTQHRPNSIDGNNQVVIAVAASMDDAINGVGNIGGSNLTTASSSLVSLLSSTSSNTATCARQRKFHLSEPNNDSPQILPPSNSGAIQQKIRLPVFERLSLNQ